MSAQQDLFGDPEALPIVKAAAATPQLLRIAAGLPKNLHLGTSSWTFPGWAGSVYDGFYSTSVLARHGLRAYAEHPLLNLVSLDSTFYRPATAQQLARFAAQVPDGFRFLVKAYCGLTTSPQAAGGSRLTGEPVFLDADFATRAVIGPVVEGLGSKLGAVLFQFSPLGAGFRQRAGFFASRLAAFLGALPIGPQYAVELRDSQVLGAPYEAALAAAGAVHCRSVHSRMPPVDEQVSDCGSGPLIIRWMLRAGDDYQSAAARFAPFDRLAEPDELNRGRIARMVRSETKAGRDVHVVAANNAEGSAPATLLRLAASLLAAS